MKNCRDVCVWARACSLWGGPDINPEECERAELLKHYWKTPEKMNEDHDYFEMLGKVEDEMGGLYKDENALEEME